MMNLFAYVGALYAARPPPQQQYYGPQMQGGHHGQPQQPFFQYSQCTGSKKALCVSPPSWIGERG